MKQYTVTGMSCAACQARVEKAVSALPGVHMCSVSLLTNSMGVEGDVAPAEIIRAVENAGYGAALKEADTESNGSFSAKLSAEEDALKDRETPLLKHRLFASLGFLLVLMYFSMGHMMFGLPLPRWFNGNHVAMGLVELLLAAVIMVINQKFFISGINSLLHRSPNMDSLIALGSAAAFLYSTVMLFAMTDAQVHMRADSVIAYMDEFYFESAAMILTLITVGKLLEAYSKGKTTSALKNLLKLAPKTATLLRNGSEITVPVDEVHRDDIFVVRPGESIPVDGVVLEGCSAVNEAALTGESIPVDKEPGNPVSSATLNQSGFLKCRATRVGEDSSYAQIIRMVSDAAATKAPIAKLADRISAVFVPIIITLALIATVVWLLVGRPLGFALARGICVLVVSCPCALGLATPVAIMVGNGVGAKNGILFKNAEALQETGRVEIIALDKTGTITTGTPVVTDLFPSKGISEDLLLQKAASLEQKSEHPLAKAIIQKAEECGIATDEVTEFLALTGSGLSARLNGIALEGGNLKRIRSVCEIPTDVVECAEELAKEGKTPLFFAEDNKLMGLIAVADTMKEDSSQAIRELQNMGIRVVMLTGDNEQTAQAIGKQAGVDDVVAGVLPDGKEKIVRELQKQGRVAMVGDGINDAPALTRADIGIAIGAGTDIAIDAADVVLMQSRLSDVPAAVRLSRKTYRNILENLFWALFYNALLIPIAAGAYVHSLGITMNPMLGAAAMSLSSFCVVSNALRLNLFDPRDARSDHKRKGKTLSVSPVLSSEREIRTMIIEGMMCSHCEATVKKALENLDGVAEASVSHESGTAIVQLFSEISDEVLKQAVEAEEYEVREILHH